MNTYCPLCEIQLSSCQVVITAPCGHTFCFHCVAQFNTIMARRRKTVPFSRVNVVQRRLKPVPLPDYNDFEFVANIIRSRGNDWLEYSFDVYISKKQFEYIAKIIE